MPDPMKVGGVGTPKVDESRWKKLTAQEIIKEQSEGEDVPAEIVAWAQQMAAIAKIPDNVTYEQVDGDVGLDVLEKLGIEDETLGAENNNAIAPEKTEDPSAVKDISQTVETEGEDNENIFINPPQKDAPTSETATETEDDPNVELGLADDKLTADNDEIRKRKARKGLE